MKKYLLKRILISIVTLFCILLILFIMLNLLPGSPFNSEKLSDEQKAVVMAKYGLDKPVIERFLIYLKNMLKGDFGVSYNIATNVPISDLLREHMPITVYLGLASMIIGSALGMSAGFFAALNKNGIGDLLCSVLSIIGISIPSYIFAICLAYFIGFQWEMLPLLYDFRYPVLSSVMPVIAYSLPIAAVICRFTRDEATNVMKSDYVLFARSQGIDGSKLLFGYVLRNSLMPVITIITLMLVNLLTGSMVVENIFSIPGIGNMMTMAVTENDYNVIIALAFVYAVLFIIARLILDIIYGIIDPRVRIIGKE